MQSLVPIYYNLCYKVKAISDLQESLTVNDQGKDTGILTISLNGIIQTY
jgi:tyrosine-protein kinase Etk/Wzc